ncbi:hypothetical protein MSAN_00949000 [Mycena sanguinolenta]|uniref:RRM domain-containing protein n=1 Tax=Mycena sanguinolenta TaxID=230812 RepID=A0A8H6YTI2_9AGAR|nr:hypothetical protein MSAN_00949000 [Mycena sanguinolenta]
MSKVVFVGNIASNLSEDALTDVFRSVGQVVGFRLAIDRDTGRPKGYALCEFADHETAASAVRNLNDTDVGGRRLRIDLEPDLSLGSKTTLRGEIADVREHERGSLWRNVSRGPEGSEILATIPPGNPLPPGERATETIDHTIAQRMTGSQLIEVIAQMKAFVITHPKQAHQFLSHHPQVAYAVFRGLITTNLIPRDILNEMPDRANANRSAPPAHLQPPEIFTSPPRIYPQPQQPQHQPYPPLHVPHPQPVHSVMLPAMRAPPTGEMYDHMQPTPPSMPPLPPYYRGPPQPLPSQQPPQLPPHVQPPPQQSSLQPLLQLLKDGGENNPDARALYSIILALTPPQINNLPAAERDTIESLRSMLMKDSGAV